MSLDVFVQAQEGRIQWFLEVHSMHALTQPIDIKELDREQLAARLVDLGLEPYRASQILKWTYLRQTDTFDAMTDLGLKTRTLLSREFCINRLSRMRIETSSDGSRKYLFGLQDGCCVESVLIPEKGHYTLCISSQVGCAQGCAFCLTGQGGLVRNLTRGEIIAQVRDVLKELDGTTPLSNIVFMGMGEPLANYSNLLGAIKTLTDNVFGLKFANRRITVSTAGLIPRLSDLGRDTQVKLAISLNAADNRTRSLLMPINRKYPIEQLLEACRRFPLRRGVKITFEYILISGINDSPEDAARLARLLNPARAKINLIPFNEHDRSEFKRPPEAAILQFQDILCRNNYTAMIRRSKGSDISAACGQLGAGRQLR